MYICAMDELLTIEEIIYLRQTVSNGLNNRGSKTWQKAFNIYNNLYVTPLNMNCRSCYSKVLQMANSYAEIWITKKEQ